MEPHSHLRIVVEGNHFVSNQEGFFGVKDQLSKAIKGSFKDGKAFKVGELVDVGEPLKNFFSSDSEKLVLLGNELMGENNNNILRIAWWPEFINFYILWYSDIVIFDDVFFKLSAGFRWLHKGRRSRYSI